MNKRVIKTMIILCVVYLIVWYILKFFIPEKFVLRIENEKLIMIGQYVDAHHELKTVLGIITSFITYWLYLCAVTKRPTLPLVWCLITLIVIICSFAFEAFMPEYIGYYSILFMFILPALMGAELKTTTLVFTVHFVSQMLSLQIRGLNRYMLSFDYMSLLVMTCEMYFWLFLFYLYNNYKEVKIYDD